jgi:hypothetical protein
MTKAIGKVYIGISHITKTNHSVPKLQYYDSIDQVFKAIDLGLYNSNYQKLVEYIDILIPDQQHKISRNVLFERHPNE